MKDVYISRVREGLAKLLAKCPLPSNGSPQCELSDASPTADQSSAAAIGSSASASFSSASSTCSSATSTGSSSVTQRMTHLARKRARLGFLRRLNFSVSREVVVSSLDAEISDYLDHNSNSSNEFNSQFNTLVFFKTYSSKYPNLSHLARLILSIPSTSVPAEALFSSAEFVQNEQRNRLEPEILEAVNFIKCNL